MAQTFELDIEFCCAGIMLLYINVSTDDLKAITRFFFFFFFF